MAARLRLPLKLSRVWLVARVLVILVVSYADLITDIGMLFEYNANGNHNALAASACFLGLGWVIHLYFAYLQNKGRGTSVVCKEILVAATFTAPAVATYRFVVGEVEKEEEDCGNQQPDNSNNSALYIPASLVYSFVKMVELVFESVPESILQASNLMTSDAHQVTPFSVLSLASSIFAAG